MDLIDKTLKSIVDNVDIELNAALKELQTAIANAEDLLEPLVGKKEIKQRCYFASYLLNICQSLS